MEIFCDKNEQVQFLMVENEVILNCFKKKHVFLEKTNVSRLTCLIQENVQHFLEVIMFCNLISSSMTIGLFRNLHDFINLPDVMTC